MNPIQDNHLRSFQEKQEAPTKRSKTSSPFFQAYEIFCQENDIPSQVSCSDLDQMGTKVYELVIGQFAIITTKSAPDQSFILSRTKKTLVKSDLSEKN